MTDLPELRFSPTAWAKLLFMRDAGNSEVSGWGVSHKDDLFFIEDFVTVKQKCTAATTEMDDDSILEYIEKMVAKGYHPNQLTRIWIHTHPANSASPSGEDERTFERLCDGSDWAVMFILAKGGQVTARLYTALPEPFEVDMKSYIEYQQYDFKASKLDQWQKEYDKNVEVSTFSVYGSKYSSYGNQKNFGDSTNQGTGIVQPKSFWPTGNNYFSKEQAQAFSESKEEDDGLDHIETSHWFDDLFDENGEEKLELVDDEDVIEVDIPEESSAGIVLDEMYKLMDALNREERQQIIDNMIFTYDRDD